MYEIVIMIIYNIITLYSHMVTCSHITRAVLGPARHEDVPPCHGAVLGPSKKLIVPRGTARRAKRA
jgi:hypothetical protein